MYDLGYKPNQQICNVTDKLELDGWICACSFVTVSRSQGWTDKYHGPDGDKSTFPSHRESRCLSTGLLIPCNILFSWTGQTALQREIEESLSLSCKNETLADLPETWTFKW